VSELIDNIVKYQQQIGVHRAGTLSAQPLERLEWYFQNYFQGKSVRSVETGCGASTIVFAHYATHHTSYCYDDRSESDSSVAFAQNFPGFRDDRVRWVFGPTQTTLPREPLEHDVDVVLIDGPHGYPFPELEYFAFYKWLRPRGILIVDDVHIPTINNLYRFLLQDDSFRPHGRTLTTAYFQRAETPAFNMEGDDWWLQRYNVQHFPVVRADAPNEGVKLPISVSFDRRLTTGEPILTRGFSVIETPPVSEGAISTIELRLADGHPRHVRVDLDIEPVAVPERPNSGITVLVNTRQVGKWIFGAPGRKRVQIEAPLDGVDTLTIELWNHDLRRANELTDWTKATFFDGRLPNFRLHALTVVESDSQAEPARLQRADGSLLTFTYDGQEFSFFVDQADDSVQVFHTVGRFYESAELETLRAHLPPGASILDVGAHVGNHTVFFERVMHAGRVVPIEPSPRAQFLLRTNCALNQLHNVDLSHLGVALGSRRSTGTLIPGEWFNSGGNSIRPGYGPIAIVRGDDLFAREHFDLIKIDVEGMELEVLEGLARTIARCRPLMFIEVKDQHRDRFLETLDLERFQIRWQGQMYPQITNYLISPPAQSRRWTNLVPLRRGMRYIRRVGRQRMSWLATTRAGRSLRA